jgi:hypothetical protein
MTDVDVKFTIGLLTAWLVVGFVVNLWLLWVAIGDWRVVLRSQQNGPRQVIAIAAVRRKSLRALMQIGLILLYGARVWTGRPPGPMLAIVVGVELVVMLTADTICDSFDRRLLRWFLRRTDEPNA